MTTSARLRAVAAELTDVLRGLDQTAKPCESCGLNVKHNFDEAQIASQLTSMSAKLNRFADTLAAKEIA